MDTQLIELKVRNKVLYALSLVAGEFNSFVDGISIIETVSGDNTLEAVTMDIGYSNLQIVFVKENKHV